RPTWRGLIKADVDEAIEQAKTEKQFFSFLREKGYTIKIGADITLRPPGKERGMKLLRNFGAEYAQEAIRRRILAQTGQRPQQKIRTAQVPSRIQVPGNKKSSKKIGGLRGLYLHYCYFLGIFPKNRNETAPSQVPLLLREDLLKLNTISKETRLLCRHQIDTAEQL
ncbi:relaxase/mobilization nuclease, partial [Anaerovorax odorimutans]|nr:relaxase/mobilization nuclease [Anaerovorax odorimutans]